MRRKTTLSSTVERSSKEEQGSAWQATCVVGHLHAASPLCSEAPRSAWLGQQGAGARAQGRCSRALGRSGLFTTSRPGCTPCAKTPVRVSASQRLLACIASSMWTLKFKAWQMQQWLMAWQLQAGSSMGAVPGAKEGDSHD